MPEKNECQRRVNDWQAHPRQPSSVPLCPARRDLADRESACRSSASPSTSPTSRTGSRRSRRWARCRCCIVQADGEETVIFESAVILEFLEETQANPLHPADALRPRPAPRLDRVRLDDTERHWPLLLCVQTRQPSWPSPRRCQPCSIVWRMNWPTRPGPWFGGERFCLVDAVYGPVFRYLDAFDRIGDFGMLDGKPLVQAWRKALSERASIKAAVAPDYPQRLHQFLRAKKSFLSTLIRPDDLASPPPLARSA